jgi:hypothetical protein
MNDEFRSHSRVVLRDVGKDEKWLQTQIAKDPSILGLGDLTLFRKELKQAAGGRLDMLLSDPESETLYEVEIQLGETDPSHIIRTIEYWDIETRRYPNQEHRAVIIAEKISNRFFNVVWLLNRSLPIIAIELAVLKHDEGFLLHFTKVLDIYQSPETIDEQPDAIVDRKYWEDRSSADAMAVFDGFRDLLLKNSVEPKLNFRQDGIALAGKWNFAKVQPRKSGDCLLRVGSRLPEEVRKEIRLRLEECGVPVKGLSAERFWVRLNKKSIEEGAKPLVDLVKAGIAFEG